MGPTVGVDHLVRYPGRGVHQGHRPGILLGTDADDVLAFLVTHHLPAAAPGKPSAIHVLSLRSTGSEDEAGDEAGQCKA